MANITLKAAQTDEELRQAHDLMARRHFMDYDNAMRWLGGFGQAYPGFLREHTRIAVDKGHVVAALRMTTDTIRIGEARLKMGGLSCVSTDARYGAPGVVSRVIADALQYMRRHQYHAALLFGEFDYYRRWGFAPALHEYGYSIPVTKITERGGDRNCRIRAAKPSDIPAMQKMHGQYDGATACSIVRTSMHLSSKWQEITPLFMLVNPHGKAVAYFRGMRQGHDFVVDEMGVSDEESTEALLHTAARMTREQFLDSILFLSAPQHPVIDLLREKIAENEISEIVKPSGMMTFIHFAEALESMIPEWENRLQETALARIRTEVTLMLPRTALRLRVNHGAVSILPDPGENKLPLSPEELIQLTTGYTFPEDILDTRRRALREEARLLVRTFFPKRTPYIWPLDRF